MTASISHLLFASFLISLLIVACKPDSNPIDPRGPEQEHGLVVDDSVIRLDYPAHFPAPEIPAENLPTVTKVALGKRLFYDPILSSNSTVSCASCHFQQFAFADPNPFSRGVNGVSGDQPHLRRNAPPLFNLAWHKTLFWDGAIEGDPGTMDLLENQVRVPIDAVHEMNSNFPAVVARLRADSSYVNHFYRAFGDSITPLRVMQAIATFERTLISAGSTFDEFAASNFEDTTIFTPSEYRGFKLYFGESSERHPGCFHCHAIPNFDDPTGDFFHNGVFEEYEDYGRYLVESTASNFAKFKTPSLRNLSYTAPYMHNGSIPTLDSVLEAYRDAGQRGSFQGQVDPNIERIGFTDEEKQDLIAFLLTLDDPDFLTNPAFQPE